MWLGARHAPPAASINAPRLRRPPCRSHSGPPAQPSAAAAPVAALEPQHAAPSRERARRHVVGQVAGQHHRACRGAWGGSASLVRVILGAKASALDLGGVGGHSAPPAVTRKSKPGSLVPTSRRGTGMGFYVRYREAGGLPTPTHTTPGRLDQQPPHMARRLRVLAHESTGLPTEVMPVVVAVVVPRSNARPDHSQTRHTTPQAPLLSRAPARRPWEGSIPALELGPRSPSRQPADLPGEGLWAWGNLKMHRCN